MANQSNETATQRGTVVLTSTEFRADARAAIREAVAGKCVTVNDAQGRPRMHIVRQTRGDDD
jgi:hypothetical protein